MSEADGSKVDGGIVTSGTMHKLERKKLNKRKTLFVAAAAFALVVVGTVVLAAVARDPGVAAPPYDPNAPKEYYSMTPKQIRGTLYHNTKLDTDLLKINPITKKTFKDFDQAFEAGQALAALKENKKAGQAYAEALKRADKSTQYTFYLEYASLAEVDGNESLAKGLYEKAVAAVQADKSLNDARKKALVDELAGKQKLKELEKTE